MITSPGTADRILTNIGQLVTLEPSLGHGVLGMLENAGVALSNGKILWIGASSEVRSAVKTTLETENHDMGGQVVTPGLIDCHTHLVFAGSRVGEFDLRVAGASYQEIGAAGGGIASTMQATRDADSDLLLDLGLNRLNHHLRHGVTTCEIKSGYGLSFESELKILDIVCMLELSQPMTLVPTFLGAHTVPPEYRANRQGYLDQVINRMLPEIASRSLARFCDVFCEQGAFSVEESRQVLEAGIKLGLRPRVHAEQLSHFGGAKLAAELGAASADHLEYVDDASLKLMREAGTVAVLLPGAAFFLGHNFPNAGKIRDAGVPIAIATDFNPGTSPTLDLALMGTMAAVRMGMSPSDVMMAITRNAAKALCLEEEIGTLRPGKKADLAVWKITDYRTIFYEFGRNHCAMVIKDGDVVFP